MKIRISMSAAILATVLGLSVRAQGQNTFTGFRSGSELFELCIANSTADSYCSGYIAGIEDVLVAGNAVNGFKACFPGNTSGISQNVVTIAVAYLRDHPELRLFYAPGLVAAALARAFPCP